MATEGEVPVTKESLEEKLGDLKIEEPEKFEDTSDAPVAETPEEAKEAVLEELKETPPELHHVETKDTTDPVAEPTTGDSDVVKAEVPEAFAEELKSDHDIAPPAAGTPTSSVESVATETGAEKDGQSAPATREVPVEVTHEDVDKKPSKISSIGDKISSTFHKIVGKD